jgi:hypothetical protein
MSPPIRARSKRRSADLAPCRSVPTIRRAAGAKVGLLCHGVRAGPARIIERLDDEHPYDVPGVFALPIADDEPGLPRLDS